MGPLARAVPEPVRRRALARGPSGEAWLEGLDGLVAGLLAEWGLMGAAVLTGGTEALVIATQTLSGEGRVLKLSTPGIDPSEGETRLLTLAEGRGYATLFAADTDRGALLLERLGPNLKSLDWPMDRQNAAICGVLREAWIEADDASGLVDGAAKAESLAAYIGEMRPAWGGGLSDAAVERAFAFAEERRAAFDPSGAVLAHGDGHAWNTLLVPGSVPARFKFVDPDGLYIEPAYDLGILMREDADDLLGGDAGALGLARCRQLADLTGQPERAIWQWGYVERISTGLGARSLGMWEAEGMLEVAEAWAKVEPPKAAL